jgi:hypothetical protein
MRIVAIVLALGAAALFGPRVAGIEPALAAAIAIAACVSLTTLIEGRVTTYGVAVGALAALGYCALLPVSRELAGAMSTALVLAPRALRGRNALLRGSHVLAALAGGGVASAIAQSFDHGRIAVQGAAVLVAGIVAAGAMAFPSDDAVGFALAQLAPELPDETRPHVLRALALRRSLAHDEDPGVSRRGRDRLERAWHALVEAARARLFAQGNSAALLETRIASHVDALERVYAAAGERQARVVGLDDKALTAARLEGDALLAEASALAEVDPPQPKSA